MNEDKDKIVHELQVYQIELQMQNEELRNARHEVQDLLNKYTELYDFAPVSLRYQSLQDIKTYGAQFYKNDREIFTQ